MTAPAAIYAVPQGATTLTRMPPAYLWLAGLVMATGSTVFVEPAPYDVALVLLLGAGVVLRRFWFHASHRLPAALVLCFLAANLLSLTQATDLPAALKYLSVNAYMTVCWLFFVGITSAHGYRAVLVLMRGYTLAGVLAVALSAFAFFGVIRDQSLLLGSGRAQGLFKDPNVYGPYLVPMLLFALAQLQGNRLRGYRFLLGLAVCAISAMGLFLSYSRAAWIDGGVAILCFFGLQTVWGIITRQISKGLLYSILFVVVLAGAVVFIGASSSTPMGRMLAVRIGDSGLQNYDATRFETHRRAFDTALEQPLGVGPGQSELLFQLATHNMYLRILTENGILGFLALYGFFLLSLLRAAKGAVTLADKSHRDLFALVSACLLGIYVNGLVIDTIHWRHLWFLLGLAWWVPRTAGDPEGAQP